MQAVRLPAQLQHKLDHLAEETGRTKSHYIRLAIENFLEEREDYLLAVARLEKKNPKISLEEMEQLLGVED